MDAWIRDLLAIKGVILFGWIVFLLIVENGFKAAPIPLALAGYGWPWWRRWGRNFGLALINGFLSQAIILPVSLFAALHPLWQRPFHGWPGLGLDLLLLDLWIYWWHRANHEIPFLWRFHQIHHRDEFLDASSALRFHFSEVILSALVRALVVMLAAIPFSSVLIFETLVLMAALFHHSNWRLFPRLEALLSRLIITPRFHWMHHHAVREDTDSTYGTFLSCWDRLFGTLTKKHRTAFQSIGMPGGRELPFLPLILRPFRNSDD